MTNVEFICINSLNAALVRYFIIFTYYFFTLIMSARYRNEVNLLQNESRRTPNDPRCEKRSNGNELNGVSGNGPVAKGKNLVNIALNSQIDI